MYNIQGKKNHVPNTTRDRSEYIILWRFFESGESGGYKNLIYNICITLCIPTEYNENITYSLILGNLHKVLCALWV